MGTSFTFKAAPGNTVSVDLDHGAEDATVKKIVIDETQVTYLVETSSGIMAEVGADAINSMDKQD